MYPQRTARKSRTVVNAIIADIRNLPGGYIFWHNLQQKGRKGKKIVRKRWFKLIADTLVDEKFREAALKACITPGGVVTTEGKLLYKWLLRNVYGNSKKALFSDLAYFNNKQQL